MRTQNKSRICKVFQKFFRPLSIILYPLALSPVLSPFSAQALAAPKTALLVITQDGNREWHKTLDDFAGKNRSRMPTEIVYGIPEPRTLQKAVTRLTTFRTKKIIVVPLLQSSHSETLNHFRYLLGIRETPSRIFLKAIYGKHPPKSLTGIKVKPSVVMTAALDNDPRITKLLINQVKAASPKYISSPPGLVLVGISPAEEPENRQMLKQLQTAAEAVKKELSLRACASFLINPYSGTKETEDSEKSLRKTVKSLSLKGKTIVVASSLVKENHERYFRKILKGCSYIWGGNSSLTPDLVREWLYQKAGEG
ncbi:MAG: hypothetical protein ABIG11_06165, partial [bacterium]